MQLVVPMAVSAAVSAAITMRSAISMNLLFSFIVVVLRELEEVRRIQRKSEEITEASHTSFKF